MARRIPRDWDDFTEDEVDVTLRRGVRRAPPRDFLDAGGLGGALRRSRSTGARPQPNVVVVDNIIDGGRRRSPSRDRRGRRHDDDEDVIDAIEDVAREIRRNRSRTPGGFGRDWELERERERRLEMQLAARDHEAQAIRDRRLEWDLERERLERDAERERHDATALARTRAKIQRLEDQLEESRREEKRKEERERILAEKEREEWEAKEKRRIMKLELERKEQEEKDEERKMLEEMRAREAKKKKEKEESEAAAVAAYEKKKLDEKRKREELKAQIKLEEEEEKRKQKEEEERWRLKLEQKRLEDEMKKKKHQEEVDEEMRKKLHKFGFQENQVDAILDPKKAPHLQPGLRPSNALVPIGGGPTYIKIHKNHVDIETLKYFGLPWGYDPGSSDYYLIFQEMDKKETEILFEHTRKLRKRTTELLIEDRGRKHGQQQLAFVRRRTPSVSPSRGKRRETSPKRVRYSLKFA
jgi:chemotaxis protein histidine kinase CheA